jgi:hypothetical protein
MPAENPLPQPPTYIRTIQTGKSKKKSSSPGKAQAGRAFPITALYLFKEHPEGKNGGKILVLVHFSESRLEGRAHRGGERTRD